ncbi:Auxin-responsive protein SAUR72 [Hibiscus syriacus]|uniref:Auxin-responsive protein SAUR72 n=1 Tax=Hibiscus syriacus TaxID=106335 RepID=A0A6A3BSS3_HIBSY|nr:auxin-responsive protein SAUR72-like [Hibiscus syriacus]KAE8719970.1 Auxin-responsive protein SAUR72 [Hibiscus syriacus]
MKKLIRRLSQVRVNNSTQYSMLRSDTSNLPARRSDVPQGHFPVHVGIDPVSSRRFIVSAEMLRYPIFVELLNRSEQEYGYEQSGVLRIPVNVVVFDRVLEAFRQGRVPLSLDELV